MTRVQTLRLWPAVGIALLVAVLRFLLPAAAPGASLFGVDVELVAIFAGMGGLVAVLVWWLFFSRAAWRERLLALIVLVGAALVTFPLTHVSIQGGHMGAMLFVYSLPMTLTFAFVAGAALSRRLSSAARMAVLTAAIVVGCGVWTLLRTDGVIGAGSELAWRWTPTAEERLLAARAGELPAPAPAPPRSTAEAPAPSSATPASAASAADATAAGRTDQASGASGAAADAAARVDRGRADGPPTSERHGSARAAEPAPSERRHPAPVEWPGFRGPRRDSVVRGLRIGTDWSASPPVEIWRRPIGPGWSSFAVAGDFIYTQEQRGDHEIVSSYRLSTGEPVWGHRDPARFWESNAGPGPRGTPTVHDGRVYALGATGILNALDAATGAELWSRDVGSDTGVAVPEWGFAASPLVFDDLVIAAASGRLVAYDARSGEQRWLGPEGGSGYSSPHLVTIDGVPQIVLLRGSRTIGVSPRDGTLIWEHLWDPGAGIIQPAVVGAQDVLLTTGDAMGGIGTRRVSLTRTSAGWAAEERWTSRGLKPYFNDFVVHEGHAYGFDGSILSSIDLDTGERNWKGGRYGNGQMLLLADQDLLLIVSEEGELVLVSATPEKHVEVARMPLLDAKTWNHPVIVGDTLLVRNGEEMVRLRLPAAR